MTEPFDFNSQIWGIDLVFFSKTSGFIGVWFGSVALIWCLLGSMASIRCLRGVYFKGLQVRWCLVRICGIDLMGAL